MSWLQRVCYSIVAAVALSASTPSYALPAFARTYGVGCNTCHTVPPRLNQFGLAFQANFFNWPGQKRQAGLGGLPLTGQLTTGLSNTLNSGKTNLAVDALELYLYDGFTVTGQMRGGYYLDFLAGSTLHGSHTGDLGNAWVAVPVAGKRGEWAVTAGQANPILFQVDQDNSLTNTLPFALSDSTDGFSPLETAPMVRLDYFNHRGEGTADGDYFALGVGTTGQLAMNRYAELGTLQGPFVHAFRRWGFKTLGVFGYTRAGNGLGGLLATDRIAKKFYLLGAVSAGHDVTGNTQHASAEAEWELNPYLAVTGRLELITGDQQDFAQVAAINYYPFKQWYFRLSPEMVQRKADRQFLLFVRTVF